MFVLILAMLPLIGGRSVLDYALLPARLASQAVMMRPISGWPYPMSFRVGG
jgi:hypothetical protein